MENAIHDPHLLTIVLVDDDDAFVETMRQALARLLPLRGEQWTFAAYPDAECFWRDFGRVRPDIILIDIMLPGENGIEMADKLHELDKRPILAFISSSADFAVHGYGVNALRYLLKPVTDEALDNLLEACRRRLRSRRDDTLPVKTRDGWRRIPTEGVTHLQSANRQVLVHLDDEQVPCLGKLDDYIPTLPYGFLQVHKSFVVNLDRAIWMRPGEITLDNGGKVPVSRRYRKAVAARFFGGLAGKADS